MYERVRVRITSMHIHKHNKSHCTDIGIVDNFPSTFGVPCWLQYITDTRIAVLELPPSDCLRIRVSLESRYGMKLPPTPDPPPLRTANITGSSSTRMPTVR